MKVSILLQGRFPTEKAYGVTTVGTIRSLLKLGHQVTVFSLEPDIQAVEEFGSKFQLRHYRQNNLSKRLKFIAFSGMGLKSKVSWNLYWKITYLLNKHEILKERADILWIRDFAMLSLVPRAKSLIYELHNPISRLEISILKMKTKNQKVILAPISLSIEDCIMAMENSFMIIRAPMGIESEYLEKNEGIQEYLQRVNFLKRNLLKGTKISYVGKFSPNGYSKGIEDLLELAVLNKKQESNYKISIIGGTEKEMIAIRYQLKEIGLGEEDLEVSGHISHHEVIVKLRVEDVIVLPMPASKRYVGFPLKAIESIASGRIVIAARCKIYEDIFNQDFEPYWYEPGNATSMNFAINEAINDRALEDRLVRGVDFASRFTWDTRTIALLNGLASSRYNSFT